MSVVSDPIADMLTRLRNAMKAKHSEVRIPASKEKAAIAEVLKQEGYIGDSKVEGDVPKKELVLDIKYYDNKPVISGLKRISKPSCRVYVKSKEIPRVRGGMGIAILSTPEGILSGKEAKQKNVGGEVLCYVW